MSKRKTTNEFILDSKKIHGDKYDYSLVEYIKNSIKVKLICNVHGTFEVRPFDHLSKSVGCNKCNNAGISKSNNVKKNIINNFNKIHNFKYDYSLVNYVGTDNSVKIICPIHGVFEQTPHHHLDGCGCQECKGVKKPTNDEFIINSKKIHGETYNYSLVNYKNNSTKVKIICLKHGVFEQRPNDHLSKKTGCPICLESGGENIIRRFLIDNRIIFISQKRFLDCRDINPLPFDFYLPELNICIEYDGEQHFKSVGHWGGENGFNLRKLRDKIKTEYCLNKNIDLVRIKYTEDLIEKLKTIV